MREVLHAIKRWVISKFEVETRYNPLLDEVEYLRMELAKKDDLIKELISKRFDAPAEVNEVEEQEIKPVTPNYIPFHIRQQQLERDSRREARELAKEKVKNEMSKRSTAELEAELLGETNNG